MSRQSPWSRSASSRESFSFSSDAAVSSDVAAGESSGVHAASHEESNAKLSAGASRMGPPLAPIEWEWRAIETHWVQCVPPAERPSVEIMTARGKSRHRARKFDRNKVPKKTARRSRGVPEQTRNKVLLDWRRVPMANDNQQRVIVSRFDQTFPVLSPLEIDRVRPFGEPRRFRAGELLCRVGEPSPGMHVILSGRVRVISRDAFGRSLSPAEFAQMTGATPEDMEVVPGEVMADLGLLSGTPSALDVEAVDDVETIVVPPDQLRALLIADAELGERILR